MMVNRRCAVKDCCSASNRAEDFGVTFHKVPDKLLLKRAKWLELCKVKDTGRRMFVCSRHFLADDYNHSLTKISLKKSVYPSVFTWNKSVKNQQQSIDDSNSSSTDLDNSKTTGNLIITDNNSTVKNKTIIKENTNMSAIDNNQRTKRIRKKKVNPDYFTDDDMKRKAMDLDLESEKSADIDTFVQADVIESEDSTAGDISAVKPAKINLPNFDTDAIAEVKYSLSAKHSGQTSMNKTKTLKKTTKKIKKVTEEPLLISKIKSKPKEKLEKKASIIKDKIVVEQKLSPAEIKQLEGPSEKVKEKAITTPPELVNMPVIPAKLPEPLESKKIEKPAQVEQVVESSIGQLVFEPNTRVEALDFNQTWSPATIIEIDYEGTEVLVRFDSSSNQYTEWIRMDSSSIRVPCSANDEKNKKPTEKNQSHEVAYKVGEPCMAYWIDTKKFPGVVKEVIDHETYVVEFDDGYVKTLNASKMTKSSRSLQNSPLFLPVKSSKEERRKRKRKLNVQSLFKKRIKTKSTLLDSSFVNEDNSGTDESLLNKSNGSGYFDSENLWYPSFVKGRPVGIVTTLKSKAGFKASTIVPDPRLPENWQKHVLQRERGKWYCMIVSPDGRKLRGPAEVQRYINDHPFFKYKDYTFDFNISPRHSRPCFTSQKPKPKPPPAPIETPESKPPSPSPKGESLKIAQVGGVFQCPIDGCVKNFRRENLVQMHVKHYHPEFKNLLGSAPNVLDLVYKRIHGEEFEQTPHRLHDYSKRTSYTPTEELTNYNTNDVFEYQKDAEIRKLLNSTPYDSPSDTTSQLSANNSFADIKLRDILSDCVDPDLKSLVVTTKSGLKTIPPAKKENREDREVISSDGKESKKRKIDDLFDDHSGSGMVGVNESVVQMPPIVMDHIIGEDGKMIKIEHMRKEEIINCICGITEEDGLMIQCELCLCWQHAHCNNIYRENEVPEKYVCYICMNPLRQRTSMKYKHDQDWLKHGTLPTGSYHTVDEDRNQKRFDQLRISHDISGGLIDLKSYIHSLKLKLKIAELKNHPKLYLWSKPWEQNKLPEKQAAKNEDTNVDLKDDGIKTEDDVNGDSNDIEDLQRAQNEPQPEAAIETADCRINLLDHIEHCQSLIEERLMDFERKINELDGKPEDTKDNMNNIRLTTTMLLRDVNTLKEFSELDTF